MDKYRVTVFDKQANEPYYVLEYRDKEEAQRVARNMKQHYEDAYSDYAGINYEVQLHRIQGE